MPSPFPGMDPFIESRRIWSDFHLDLAAEIRAHLNARIQPGYYATAVTYVTYDVIEVAQLRPRAVSPDVSVWRTELRVPTPGAMAVIDPPLAQSAVPLEVPMRLANVEVREAGADTLVTAIEILSPINKRSGRERQRYLRKRRELLRSEVHVMELDLLRGGTLTVGNTIAASVILRNPGPRRAPPICGRLAHTVGCAVAGVTCAVDRA
jgi:hypothetical protein